jgi:hypothetical protein
MHPGYRAAGSTTPARGPVLAGSLVSLPSVIEHKRRANAALRPIGEDHARCCAFQAAPPVWKFCGSLAVPDCR